MNMSNYSLFDQVDWSAAIANESKAAPAPAPDTFSPFEFTTFELPKIEAKPKQPKEISAHIQALIEDDRDSFHSSPRSSPVNMRIMETPNEVGRTENTG